ncbi:MAG: hypothetical protein DRJ56_06265 [Thermoprotei archaeon]|nr:MAG: hypothetical protein DRJ56_06265 [Thermoprotei archaeon]
MSKGGVRPASVVLVWLDALAGDLFRDMYKGGELPNLAEYFESGAFVENAIACFPTVSESAEGGIISGFFAGETNMLGERYFSRDRRVMMHYKFNARPERDLNPRLRGSTIDDMAGESVGMGRLIHTSSEEVVDLRASYYERVGSIEIVGRRIEVASRIARERRPRLLFFTISADYISHVNGRMGAAVRDFVKRFDEEFPKLVEALDEAYGRDNYAVFVFSDHGSADVSRHLDLPKLLGEAGFKPIYTDLIAASESGNCTALSNGRRSGLVYFAHPERGWPERPGYKRLRRYPLGGGEVDLLSLLAEEEGVAQAFAKRDEHSVVVVSREGEAVIEHDPRSNRYRYTVVRGDDPLGYDVEPRWMSEEEWLEATCDKEYPDAVAQLYHIFDAPNCGDIVLNAAPGWDFWEPWDIPYPRLVAAHGGLSRDEMSVFVLAKGPGIREGVVPRARLLDVFATIAAYYNAPQAARGSHAVERLLQ